ncbi:hypothetical protein C8J56DRAFT_990915 [Mycena floridula]|nr:hypothetical protein C8J56DRAFT_990915 [Mycena floridula]
MSRLQQYQVCLKRYLLQLLTASSSQPRAWSAQFANNSRQMTGSCRRTCGHEIGSRNLRLVIFDRHCTMADQDTRMQ